MKTLKKRRRIIEIIWLAVLLLALTIFFSSHFGLEAFFSSTVPIKIKDTVLPVPKYFVFFFISTLSFFVVYSLKVFIEKFKTAISNTVFLISIICLIVVLTYLVAFNMAHSEETIPFINNGYLIFFQIVLICLFGFVIKKKTLLK